MHEFKPEQVKRYLAREVIAGLPNAAAIDLSQFAGLFDADARDDADADEGGEYRELLAALRSAPAAARAAPVRGRASSGRWTEVDARRDRRAPRSRIAGATPSDAVGRPALRVRRRRRRRPAPRRAAGGGAGAPLRGRQGRGLRHPRQRHLRQPPPCRDLARRRRLVGRPMPGSTNGMRVESAGARAAGPVAPVVGADAEQPIRLGEGARIVLSARAEGPASDYPWLALRSPASARGAHHADRRGRRSPTDAADGDPAGDAPAEPCSRSPRVQGGGVRTLELRRSVAAGDRGPLAQPDAGRRPPARRRVGPSPRHRRDRRRRRPTCVVHGDNGVLSTACTTGRARACAGRSGETMVLGASAADHPTCTLTLARQATPEWRRRTLAPGSLITPLEPGARTRARARRAAPAVAQQSVHDDGVPPHRSGGGVVVRQPARRQRRRAQRICDGSGGAVRRRRRRGRRRDGAAGQPRSSSTQLHARARRPPARRRRACARAMLDADRAIARAHRAADRPARRRDGRAVRAAQRVRVAVAGRAGSATAASTGCAHATARRGIELLTRDDTFRAPRRAAAAGRLARRPGAHGRQRRHRRGANVALHDLACGDLLVLCSDGVHKHLDADDWAGVLQPAVAAAASAATDLIALARANGSADDATVLLLRRARLRDARPRWITRCGGPRHRRRTER